MPSSVDLHTHTTASDGTLKPHDFFAKALELQIRVLSITDHDSTEGLSSLLPEIERHPEIRVIPGIELSAEGDLACHLLGYFIELNAPGFQEKLAQLRHNRLARIQAMTDKVCSLGYPVEYARVLARAQGGSVGRPHLADAMVECGHVKTRKEAFDRFLKKDGPAYITGTGLTAQECITLIRSARGVPVLAHPSYYTSAELLQELANAGLMGIEVYYPEHSPSLIRRYSELAKEKGLVMTGGSDFHGPKTQRAALASVNVPESVVADLDAARSRV